MYMSISHQCSLHHTLPVGQSEASQCKKSHFTLNILSCLGCIAKARTFPQCSSTITLHQMFLLHSAHFTLLWFQLSPSLLTRGSARQAAGAWSRVLTSSADLVGSWYLSLAAVESRMMIHSGVPVGSHPASPLSTNTGRVTGHFH